MAQSLGITSLSSMNRIDVERYSHLKLPDGRVAASLGADTLRKELQRLGVPEINEVEGVQSMLPKLAKFIDAHTVIQWPVT